MKTRLLRTLLVGVAAIITSQPIAAYDFTSDNINYNIISEEDRTVAVAGANLPDIGDIIIPSRTISQGKTYSVIAIGKYAFSGLSNIASIYIPSTVTIINDCAFKNCSNLTDINIDDGNQFYASIDGVLYSKDLSLLIQYPIGKTNTTFSIPSNVTHIGNNAFSYSTNLTSVDIPSSVTSIGNHAFYSCQSLESIRPQSSVTSIGEYAFYSCPNLRSVSFLIVTSIGEYAFYECTNLGFIDFPSATAVPKYAFSHCIDLTSVELPKATEIGERAFQYCSNLSSIDIQSMISIGERAFDSCTSLTVADIPSSVTTIGNDAFFNCSKLAAINVNADNQSYASIDGVLYSKNLSLLIQYPMGKTDATFQIPDNVTSIGTNAFYNCAYLTSVDIPDSTTSIEGSAFCGCTNLTEVNCHATTPPNAPNGVFANETLMGTLSVPIGSKADYEAVDPWRNFWNIEENAFSNVATIMTTKSITVTTSGNSIIIIGKPSGNISVYSVNGQCVYNGTETVISNLAKGVYIVKTNNFTTKAIL